MKVEIGGARAYLGPNLFAPVPVLCLTVEAGALEPVVLERLEFHLNEMLDGAARSLVERRWSRFPPADCAALAGMAASGLAGLLAGLAVRLQALLGHDLQFAATEPGTSDGGDLAVFAFRDLTVARLAGRASLRILAAALGSNAVAGSGKASAEQALRRFLQIAAQRDLPPMQTDLVLEAIARDIPWERTFHGGGQLELGQGCMLQRFSGSYTSSTSYIATMIATNKHQASAFFRRRGIPAAENALVGSEAEAVTVAKRFGYPVVIKPSGTDYGTAVHTNLSGEAAVRWAYGLARRHGSVLVERHVPGDHHRLLVMYGKVAYVMVHTPARVFGDGQHSIKELVKIENQSRGETFSHDYFKRITVDDQVIGILKEQGFTADDKPIEGQEIRLRMQANISQGGTAVYVDDRVHPENRDMALRAARLAGFDVAGVDFVTTDISRPFHETGGAICEINPTPGWVETPDRFFTRSLMAPFFPPGEDGRIPTVSVLGAKGAAELSELVYRVLVASGLSAGLATRDGAMVDGQSIGYGDFRGQRGCDAVLRDPSAAAAVLECSFALVETEGFGFDRCSIGVILAPQPDDGDDGLDEDLRARATALLATLSRELVVVLADDPFAMTLAEILPYDRLCLVAADSEQLAFQEHRNASGPAVLCHPEGEIELFPAGQSEGEVISVRHEGRLPDLTIGLVCAVAMGLKVDGTTLATGLDFDP